MKLRKTVVFKQQAMDHIEAMIDVALDCEPPAGIAVWVEVRNDDYVVEVEFYEIGAEVEDEQQGGEGSGEGAGEPDSEQGREDARSVIDDAIRDGRYP